jgi:hypothetical protein
MVKVTWQEVQVEPNHFHELGQLPKKIRIKVLNQAHDQEKGVNLHHPDDKEMI